MNKLNLDQFDVSSSQRGKVYRATLRGVSPLLYGRYFKMDKLDGESHEAYEERTWKERMHYDKNENVYIPQTAFTNMMANAAQREGEKIPGKGNATYTKHFKSGIIVEDPAYLYTDSKDRLLKDDCEKISMHVPSDGKTGGTKRVMKHFPAFSEWKCDVEFLIIDNVLTEKIFAKYLINAGWYIGLLSMRIQNRGVHGRFKVEEFKYE